MIRSAFLTLVLVSTFIGCGPNTDDASRVPAGAPDNSDPSKVMMGGDTAPGTPKGAVPGPGAAK